MLHSLAKIKFVHKFLKMALDKNYVDCPVSICDSDVYITNVDNFVDNVDNC